jgi:type IV secretion system protein VirB1
MTTLALLVAQCAPSVAPSTMTAVVTTESRGNPFTIGVNRAARLVRQPTDFLSAVTTAKRLIARGFNIDLGIAQINSANLTRLGLSVEDAFDPCRNLAASARVLSLNYSKASRRLAPAAALGAAISMYNTGSPERGFRNGYVARVYRAAAYTVPALPVRTSDSSTVIAGTTPANPGNDSATIASVPDAGLGIVARQSPAQSPPPAWDVFARAAFARITDQNREAVQ